MDDPLLKQYLRKKRSYTHKGNDVYVKRNTLTTLEPTTPILPKQKIADVRIPKTKTILKNNNLNKSFQKE